MLLTRTSGMAAAFVFAMAGLACETSMQGTLPSGGTANFPAPDGIDPRNPSTERSTMRIDFTGVKTIRIELPTGRVNVTQSDSGADAVLKVTELVLLKGLSNEVLGNLLTGSGVTAERSFVDDSRLDVEATIAEGLADADIVFDVGLVVPSGVNIEIFLGNGPVEVADLTGNIQIRTANGPVTIERVNGNVIAETSQRPIDAVDVTGNMMARTAGADITLRLSPPVNGRVSAETSEANIRLSIAQTTAATLSLNATDGIISTNLAGFSVTNITTGSGFLSGVLNGGGGQIDATAPNGEITFVGM